MAEETIFDKIITGDIPAAKVYEDDDLLVIMDAFPMNDGHCLILPKVRAANLYELDEVALTQVTLMSKKLAIAAKKAMQADGVKIVQNNDPAAHQSVFYYHMHVIPCYDGVEWKGHHTEMADSEVLSDFAEKIKVALQSAT